MQRIATFDRMKGVAMIAVVTCHFSGITLGLRNNALAEACSIFMLPLFFLVSGYFSYKANTSFNLPKTIKRCLTLLFPLLSWSAIETIAFHRPWDYYITHGFAGLWFFWAILLLVIINAIIEYILNQFKQSVWIDIAVYGCVFVVFIFLYRYTNMPDLLDARLIVSQYRYFVIGIFLHKYLPLKKILLSYNLIPLWLLIFFTEWLYFEHLNTILIFLGSVAGVMLVWHLCERIGNHNELLSRILAKIGRRTLPIYCIHWLFIPHDWNVNPAYFSGIGALLPQFAISMGGVSIILLLSVALYQILSLNRWCRLILFGEWPRKETMELNRV